MTIFQQMIQVLKLT